MNEPNDLQEIFDLVIAFNKETRYEKLLNIILKKMMGFTKSDAGTLYIVEDGELHFRIVRNITLDIYKQDDIDLPSQPIVKDSESVSVYSAFNNETVVVGDVYTDTRFNFAGAKNYDKMTGYTTRSMLVMPLTFNQDSESKVIGVIQLLNAEAYDDERTLTLLPGIANIAANTLANLTHISEIRSLFHSFATAMAKTIDERSSYNSNHTINVATLCEKFAMYLNTQYDSGDLHFDYRRMEELIMSAILHDIGKIITPISIMDKSDRLGERLPTVRFRFELKRLQVENDFLTKKISPEDYEKQASTLKAAKDLVEEVVVPSPITENQVAEIAALSCLTYTDFEGNQAPLLEKEDIESLSVRFGTLTAGERRVMQEHAAITGRILENASFSKYYGNVLKWAQSHHEFLDGSGYPLGIQGDEVTTEISILTMMDIFEALTASDRPYKRAQSVDNSLNILADMADEGKLNKELVEIFTKSRCWEGVVG
ncbi:MAG: HD domain-containing protein [Defluviitaleaceae bacterium]|nr:HD domain-containing protein [Defluviitaleaceae bacterium]